MKTAPRGYDPDHPAIEYLRLKGFSLSRPLTNKLMLGEGAVDEIIRTFESARPLVDFVGDAISR